MRATYLLLLACALCAAASALQGQADAARREGGAATSAATSEGPPRLELTTSVLERRYCRGDDLRLKLRLHYVNNGGVPVIMHVYHSVRLAYVSQSAADALGGKHRPSMHYSPLYVRLAPLPEEAEPGDEFVTIKPGASYDGEAYVGLPLRAVERGSKDDLPPGDYALRVVVRTWYGRAAKAEELRTRWSSFGFFWSDEVTSQPMALRIESRPPTEDCK